MGSKRSRWWLVGGIVAGVAAAGAGAALVVKKAFAPGFDDDLYDTPQGMATEVGPSATYPAEGSGTGWPEPQRTDENVELVPPGAEPGGPPSSVGEAASSAQTSTPTAPGIAGTRSDGSRTPSESNAPVGMSSPTGQAAAGGPVRDTPPGLVGDAAPPALDLAQEPLLNAPSQEPPFETGSAAPNAGTLVPGERAHDEAPRGAPLESPPQGGRNGLTYSDHDLPTAAQGTRGSDPASAAEAPSAIPSEPPVRPPTPLTEQQTEMLQRMQQYQDDLLHAFPSMDRHDITVSDGNLAALAERIAPKAGMDVPAVLDRLQDILHATPEEATNPGTLSSRTAWPSGTEFVRRDPEHRD